MIIINYLIVCFLFGTTFLVIKVGVDAGGDPFFTAGIRFFVAGVVVYVFFLLKNRQNIKLLFSKPLFLFGFCSTFVTFAAMYWSEQYLESGLVAVLSAVGPLQMFLIQVVRGKDTMTLGKGIGIFVGLLGVLLIALPSISVDASTKWIIAVVVLVSGELFYVIGSLTSKKVFTDNPHLSPFLVNAVQMCHGGILLLVFSFIFGHPTISSLMNPHVQFSLVYLIILGSIVGHGLYAWLVQQTNPIFPTTWLYVSPIIALIAGFIVLHEVIHPISIIGALCVLVGVFFVNKEMLLRMYTSGKLLRKAS